MHLNPVERQLLRDLLSRKRNKQVQRGAMLKRDRFAERLSVQSGPLLARVRTMVYQALVALADGADQEQREIWQAIAMRESIRMAKRYLANAEAAVNGQD